MTQQQPLLLLMQHLHLPPAAAAAMPAESHYHQRIRTAANAISAAAHHC
jgi:hypothetical protein